MEIDDHEQVDEDNRPDQPLFQTLEGIVHRFHLAAHGQLGGLGGFLLRVGDDLVHLRGDGPEIAVLDIGVNVNDRTNAEMVDRPRLGISRDGGEIGEDLGRIGSVHRQVLQVLQGTDVVLGSLDDDAVADAIFRIEPEGRGGLETAAQGIQDGGGNVAGGDAELLGLGAFHGDVEARFVVDLLNMDIDRSGTSGPMSWMSMGADNPKLRI